MICIPEKIVDIFFAGLGSFIVVLFSVIGYYAKKYHFFLEAYYSSLSKQQNSTKIPTHQTQHYPQSTKPTQQKEE